MKARLHHQFSSRELRVCLKKALHTQWSRAQTHRMAQICQHAVDGGSLSFQRSVKLQGTAWAGCAGCGTKRRRPCSPSPVPTTSSALPPICSPPIYFVRALDAWQISQWANSVHYLGKKIIQQNPKHKITPTQLSAGLASWSSSEKESSRNQSWQTEKAELPVGWESKGEQNFPHSAAEQLDMLSCLV